MYPADSKSPRGKLRLLYECAPLAFIAQQAGGRATDGERDILDVEPESLHQRTPFFAGSREFMELAETFMAQDRVAVAPATMPPSLTKPLT